jgi:hypothetical protein
MYVKYVAIKKLFFVRWAKKYIEKLNWHSDQREEDVLTGLFANSA